MANHSKTGVSAGLMLSIFLLIELVLYCFGDTFTFIVGTLIIGLVFANGYNREHLEHH